MFAIILVFILRESVGYSVNPTSRRNMNFHIVYCALGYVLCYCVMNVA